MRIAEDQSDSDPQEANRLMDAITSVPVPYNEPVREYPPGSAECEALRRRIAELEGERHELMLTVGGERRMARGEKFSVVQPHDRGHVLGESAQATPQDVAGAVRAAKEAASSWRDLPFDERAAIFLRAADLLAGPWRDTLNAATMLGQSKSVQQAEIDSACELIDFWRFNVHFARSILADQPNSAPGEWNRTDHRPLDGFVTAITPFNFTAIAGNLPTAPALMGNTVVWKPASTQLLAAHYLMLLWEAAGLPPGVINLITGGAAAMSTTVLTDPDFAGLHFTGSTATFKSMWRIIGNNWTAIAPTRASSVRPEARTSWLHIPPPTRRPWSLRSSAVRSSTKAEVLRHLARPICPAPCGTRGSAKPWSTRPRLSPMAT